MEELVERLVRWNLHPEDIITHRFPLDRIQEALELAARPTAQSLKILITHT